MSNQASDPEIEIPTPQVETDPEANANPGGADAVTEVAEELPPQTPDQPQSAQVEDHQIPDEIQEPEESDEGEVEDESADVAEPSA